MEAMEAMEAMEGMERMEGMKGAPDGTGAAKRLEEKMLAALETAHDALVLVWKNEAEFMQPHLAQEVIAAGNVVEEALKAAKEAGEK